jgi:hypothetical protein
MASNPVTAYLTEKKAGFFSGIAEGARHALTGVAPEAQQFLRGAGGDAMRSAGQHVGRGVVGGGLAAAGAAAVGGAAAGASKLYDAATKAHDFRNMLEYNPDLVARHEENPKLFNQMFSTLRAFNPTFSKDPLVAGKYMREMSEDPLSAGGKVVDALNFADKVGPSFGSSVTRAAQSGFTGGKK